MSAKRRRTGLAAVVGMVAALAAAASASAVTSPVRVSGPSPFSPGCSGHDEPGTNYLNAEVEPWISVNPANTANMVGPWQQDRWSNGGSHGLVSGYTLNRGASWGSSFALFSRCPLLVAKGSQDVPGEPGSQWDRATDPWVSFGPTGVAHQISDSFNVTGRGFGNGSAILYSRSTDGGRTWSDPPTVLRSDPINTALNDKESITADPGNPNYVYAVWDRLVAPPGERANPIATEHALGYRGPTWFTRSTNGGDSWEPAHIINNPGTQNQTIANQIVVEPNGTLVNAFALIYNRKNKPTPIGRLRGFNVAVQLSSDKGASWTNSILVDKLFDAEVTTPGDNQPVRTGDIVPDVAVDRSGGPRNGWLYLVWQDARFNGKSAIAFSRSTDGGRTWSPAKRIDDAGDAQAFTASVDVNADGQLAVTYYDFRNDTPDTATALTDYWIQTSNDGGDHWSSATRVTPESFDMKTAPEAGGYFLGDYEGLDHAGSAFKLFFVQANTGLVSNRTDVFYASSP